MCDAKTLNEKFGIAGVVDFATGSHGALEARLSAAGGNTAIARQGAQVLTWTPNGQPPVVWLSPEARFKAGKSLRGGAPVCWPWFGPHPEDPSKPGHGFARNLDWQVLESTRLRNRARLIMGFTPGPEQAEFWPHAAELQLSVTLGDTLDLALSTRNTGSVPITITQALHTYFHVGDISSARVEGLDGSPYIDKLLDNERFNQAGPITIDREVDRIYLDCPDDVTIVDEKLGRRILISKSGSRSYVVWNPWAEKGAGFGDMGTDGYRKMLCVETTNAWDDAVTIEPDAVHALTTSIAVAAL